MANLQQGELIVYREPQGNDYRLEQRLRDGFIAPLAFPDIEIDVRDLV